MQEEINAIVCQICRSGDNENKLMLCDGCDCGYHIYCLHPPLHAIPLGNWLCQTCQNKSPRDQTQPNETHHNNDNSDITFIVNEILACKRMTNKEWSQYLTQPQYLTFNLARGSLWKQTYDEKDSNNIVTRYLVKWANFSYLHLSWELEEDLLVHIGPIADLSITNFIADVTLKDINTLSCYANLRYREFYPFEFNKIEKIFEILSGNENVDHYPAEPVPGFHGTNCSLGK